MTQEQPSFENVEVSANQALDTLVQAFSDNSQNLVELEQQINAVRRAIKGVGNVYEAQRSLNTLVEKLAKTGTDLNKLDITSIWRALKRKAV